MSRFIIEMRNGCYLGPGTDKTHRSVPLTRALTFDSQEAADDAARPWLACGAMVVRLEDARRHAVAMAALMEML